MKSDTMERIPRRDISDLILNDTKLARDEFLACFPGRTDEFINRLVPVSDKLADLESHLPLSDRAKYVCLFLLGAFNNLMMSYKLLINVMLIPSGNLMRNWLESLSMALLCCDSRIPYYDRYVADPKRFPVYKAPDIVTKDVNRRVLLVDQKGWETFQRIKKVYDQYSHASALSYATLFKFDTPGGIILGSEFDSEKRKGYEKELGLRTSACKVLFETIALVEKHLFLERSHQQLGSGI